MSRRDIGTDDPRVRVRAGKSSRPRTKKRPDWSKKPLGRVIAIDRGRYQVVVDALPSEVASSAAPQSVRVQAVRAKELGRGSIIMGDRVRLTGDLSGRPDTLARIVAVEERSSVLRRSLEDAPDHRGEKAIVANAHVMCIVVALADPPARTGMIDRCLVAAYEAHLQPILCLTKADLASPDSIIETYSSFDVPIVVTQVGSADAINDGEAEEHGVHSTERNDDAGQNCDSSGATVDEFHRLKALLKDHFCVLVGHSGVGKSTLINALVPGAQRAVGAVNDVTGRGRHTSTSSEAFELPGGGWIVDTPGVRSFGLGHVSVADVLGVFPDVAQAVTWCLPLCTHAASEPSCALDSWKNGHSPFEPVDESTSRLRTQRTQSVRQLLDSVFTAEAASKAAR